MYFLHFLCNYRYFFLASYHLISEYNYQILRLNTSNFKIELNQISHENQIQKCSLINYLGYNYFIMLELTHHNKVQKEDHKVLLRSNTFSEIIQSNVFSRSFSDLPEMNSQYDSNNKDTINLIFNTDVNFYEYIFVKSEGIFKKIKNGPQLN